MEQSQLDILYLKNPSHFVNKNQLRYQLGNQLLPGDSFGELGLLNNKPRVATIVAEDDLVLATLTAGIYKSTLASVEKEKIAKLMNFIKPIIMEKSDVISTEKLSNIYNNFKKEKYQRGNIILAAGQHISKIYLVKKGEVEVVDENVNELDMKTRLLLHKTVQQHKKLKILGPGEFFADERVFEKSQTAKHTVQVNSARLSVYAISFENLMRIMNDNPEIYRNMKQKYLLKRLWETQRAEESTLAPSAFQVNQHSKKHKERFMIKKSIDELIQEQIDENEDEHVKTQLREQLREDKNIRATSLTPKKLPAAQALHPPKPFKVKYIQQIRQNN